PGHAVQRLRLVWRCGQHHHVGLRNAGTERADDGLEHSLVASVPETVVAGDDDAHEASVCAVTTGLGGTPGPTQRVPRRAPRCPEGSQAPARLPCARPCTARGCEYERNC